MKLAIYYPDSWLELGIEVRVSLPRGEGLGKVWFELKQPKECYAGEVEVRLEDEDD